MRLTDFLGRLAKVKKSGPGFLAACPSHDDGKQSLSVVEGEGGRVVLHCHAGCKPADVVASLGLKLADLFPPKAAVNGHAAGPGKIAATYDYRDESGGLLFQVVRFEPKDFRQRAPDGAGGWHWKTGAIRKVLFRLPELATAGPGGVVFVVEGEKDVLALAAVGAVATCNPGGAGKWRPEFGAMLPAGRVVIVADRDEPGRKHARAVAAAVGSAGRECRIVECPKGKDAAEFLSLGGTVAELLILADRGPAVQAAAASAASPAGAASVVPPVLPEMYFDLARQRFFIPGKGGEWLPVNDTRASVHLRASGFSEYVKDAFSVSVLETALQRVVVEKSVHFAGELAGFWPGFHEVCGSRVLIIRGPKLIEPKAGEWSVLRKLLRELLVSDDVGQVQWNLFCEWLRSGYVSLREGTFRPGLVLCLCGKMGGGKSRLQSLITDCLGGRSANPYAFLTGRTDFNLDLVGAEHLTIDDDASERDHKSRQTLGQRLKKMAVANTVSIHGKGQNAKTGSVFARVSIAINDDPQDLMVLPPMEDSVKDKFLLLKIRPATFPEMDKPGDFDAFWRVIRSQLPAFLHYLLNEFEVPAGLKSARFGVKNWQHPALLLDLEDLHPWRRLMELIDHCEPWRTEDLGGGDIWEGTVQDLEEFLKGKAAGRALSVLRGPQGTGMDLRAAMQRIPNRIANRLSMGKTVWIIAAGELRPPGQKP